MGRDGDKGVRGDGGERGGNGGGGKGCGKEVWRQEKIVGEDGDRGRKEGS